MKVIISFILLFVLLTSCVATKNKHYSFNQKYSDTQVKEDIVLLKKILEANHPSLYWYTSKDSIDYYFTTTLASIADSLTETQAKNKIASIVSKIKCGHTSVRFSKQFTALAEKHRYPQFPLSIKIWKDSMVVLARYNLEDSILKRGTIVTSINGKKNKEIIGTISQYISPDGNSNNFKSQNISGNFPVWYKNTFGIDSNYTVTYLDSLKQEKSIVIKAYSPKKDTTKRRADWEKVIGTKMIKTISAKEKRQAKLLKLRSMMIDTSINTAFIKLNTFSNGKLINFFDDSFDEIQEKKIKNIVFDIRENGGGNVASSIYLLRHLMSLKFKIADTVAATNRKLEYGNHIKNWLQYWLVMRLFSSKKDDNLFHLKRYEKHYFKPKFNNHFDGNIYIIQGGYSFSAATIFSSFLKGQSNVKIIGEESGGGFYGNSAIQIPKIILPNTKLQVGLPLYKYVMDRSRPKGGGVLPDVEIHPSSDAIKKGIDLKLMEVRKLIKEKNL